MVEFGTLVLNGQPIELEHLHLLSTGLGNVRLGPLLAERIQKSRENLLRHVAEGRQIYGTNTGVGALFTLSVPESEQPALSRNIVLSHACGVGDPLMPRTVRAIMFGAICNLSQGYSGVRLELVERLADFLNHDLLPIVPGSGSIGSLTHMAHIGCALMGLGTCQLRGIDMTVAEALEEVGIGHLADLPAAMLSAGQRRRLALARLALTRGGCWLMDEPTVTLDSASLARLSAMIARHRADGGLAVIASHDALDLPGAQSLDLSGFAAVP